MNRKNITKIIIATAVFAIASGYLVFEAMQSSWTYYYHVDEFLVSSVYSNSLENQRLIRVAGVVESRGMIKNIDKMQLEFYLAGEKESLKVVYEGVVPKNFEPFIVKGPL